MCSRVWASACRVRLLLLDSEISRNKHYILTHYLKIQMNRYYISCLLLCGIVGTAEAQTAHDSTDVFYKHLEINEVTVTGLTGQSRIKEMPAPVSIITEREL